ncbi:hypothetical protein HYDPIDRAFT_104717 [Hydnomerulius pinastri MD-312]|nr:hypothetical protein HYDPIDRAFT_104717 [Hydnomerulius pinastri MD-312]
MEFTPRYPQPFTLDQAIALDPAVASDEIVRLQNSLSHLKRTQDELKEYVRELAPGEEDPDINQAIKENEITIASQDERIFMLKLALSHHGLVNSSGPISEPHVSPPSIISEDRTDRPRNVMSSSSNGLDDDPLLAGDTPETNTESQEDGVYL